MRLDALIPARLGSQRLPGKHLMKLGGKPLLDWTIEAALAADCFNRICISSDDTELLSHARSFPGIDQLERPAELATAECSSASVVRHYLQTCIALPDWLMLLQPTSPFRSPLQIREAALAGVELVSAGRLGKPAEWLRRVDGQGNAQVLESQEEVLLLNGALYLIDVARFVKDPVIRNSGVRVFAMDFANSIDIDTAQDLCHAEAMLEAGQVSGGST